MRYIGIVMPIDGPARDSFVRTGLFGPVVDNAVVLLANLMQWLEK